MRPSTPPRDIVLVHIPKTAGTAVRDALMATSGGRRVLFDYGPKASKTSKEIEATYSGDDTAAPVTTLRQVFDNDTPTFLAGHFPAAKYWPFFAPESFITFLRDPVDRVLSEFSHHRNRYGYEADIETFIRRPRLRNVMTRYLHGTDPRRFGFVGITETMAEDCAHLAAYLGIRVEVATTNVGVADPLVEQYKADPELRARIAELNRDDHALYDLFARRRDATTTPPLPKALACVGKAALVEGCRLRGHAIDTTNETAVIVVEILLGDEVIATRKANRFDADLQAAGLSRTGKAAFDFNLRRALRARSPENRFGHLTVRVKGTDLPLEGTPIRRQDVRQSFVEARERDQARK